MEEKTGVPFCTCTDTRCPCNPVNHDKGCTPCIAKNLAQREIPACFFRKAGGVKPTADWHFEDFAALINSLSGQAGGQ
ncbi:MAG: DUF6485 family protein [Clostridiales bacterium]|nr:DUF6485 family protein [Clostridiales bacterium]